MKPTKPETTSTKPETTFSQALANLRATFEVLRDRKVDRVSVIESQGAHSYVVWKEIPRRRW